MTSFRHSDLPPNVGLADLSGVAKVFYYLRSRFYPVEFADLCTLIDEIVLRDHIILVGKTATTPRQYLDAISQLTDAGVFRYLAEPVTPQRLAPQSAELIAAADAASRRGLTTATIEDAEFEITRLLGAEVKLRVPATILLRNLHNFGVSRRPRFEHSIVDLVAKNKELARDARHLHAEILRSGPPRRGFVHVDAPPLALAALKNSTSFEQLIERILDIRDRQARLRTDTAFLHERLCDPRTSQAEQAILLRDWEAKWRKSWDGAVAARLLICNTSAQLIGKTIGIVSALRAPSWSEGFSKAVDTIKDLHEATSLRALRPLHTPVRDYLLTTRNQMAAAVSRIWEHDPAAIDALMREISAPSSLWRTVIRVERP